MAFSVGYDMITDAILTFFSGLFDTLFSVLPTTPSLGLNTLMVNATANHSGVKLFDYLGWANSYFPITGLVAAIQDLVTLYTIMIAINVSLWFYHQFWGN